MRHVAWSVEITLGAEEFKSLPVVIVCVSRSKFLNCFDAFLTFFSALFSSACGLAFRVRSLWFGGDFRWLTGIGVIVIELRSEVKDEVGRLMFSLGISLLFLLLSSAGGSSSFFCLLVLSTGFINLPPFFNISIEFLSVSLTNWVDDPTTSSFFELDESKSRRSSWFWSTVSVIFVDSMLICSRTALTFLRSSRVLCKSSSDGYLSTSFALKIEIILSKLAIIESSGNGIARTWRKFWF